MCRGFQQDQRQQVFLNIKSFYVRLLFSSTSTHQQASRDSLTLHFPPRINGGPLEINGINVRPDTNAFVTLHRVISAEDMTVLTQPSHRVAAILYGSREMVRVSEGLRFEIYASDAKVLKGTIRKDEEGGNWKLEYCKSQVEEGEEEREQELVSDADVCVEVEGRVGVMHEKVEIVSRGDKTRRRRRSKCLLEEIPEQRELELEAEEESDGCCCSCCGGDDCDGDNKGAEWRVQVDVGGGDDGTMEEIVEVEMEGVRWAVDVGIWVVCLGVGFLVSKASSTRIIRQRRRRGRSRFLYF